jgi:hypothetical protein
VELVPQLLADLSACHRDCSLLHDIGAVTGIYPVTAPTNRASREATVSCSGDQ